MSQFYSKFNTKALHNSGSWMHVKDPLTDEPEYLDGDLKKPIRIKLLGSKSDKFQELISEDDGSVEKLSKEERRDHNIRRLAAITCDWENFPDHDNKPMKFTHDNARHAYNELNEVADQATAFFLEKKNYCYKNNNS